MNLKGLRDSFRQRSGDLADPPFASNDLIREWANEAQDQACRRGLLLRRTVEVDMSAGEVIELDPKIHLLVRVKHPDRAFPMLPTTIEEMDAGLPGWEAEEADVPTHYVTDYATGAIRPYPLAKKDAALTVTAWFLGEEMVKDGDEPEIRSHLHRYLVHWMLHRYYTMDDADVFNAVAGSRALVEFVKQFGEEKSARNEEWQRSNSDGMPETLV